jgi:OOP family OmpA-OmpF porin
LKRFVPVLAALAFGAAQPALSQPLDGLYFAGGGGGNLLTGQKTTTLIPGSTKQGTGPAGEVGAEGVGSVGYGFGNGLRVELEGSWRSNSFTARPAGVLTQHGSEEKFGAMGNLFFDIDVGRGALQPYLGGGGGYQWVHSSLTQATDAGTTAASGSGGSAGYQAIAGVAVPLPVVAGLSVTAEYRYLAV